MGSESGRIQLYPQVESPRFIRTRKCFVVKPKIKLFVIIHELHASKSDSKIVGRKCTK